MANVSSSNGLEKYPKLRFPGFDEPIRASHLSQYLIENKDRNKTLIYDRTDVLSVSGEYGIVNQIEFQGRSFAGESVANYHIVETNDIVYTKSPLKANPYGIIKVNNGSPGIVSTLYAVYHPLQETEPQYVDYYFGNDLRLNKYLKPLVNIGAKHDMKVNNVTVLTGEVYFPSYEEQKKIATFLAVLDKRIYKQRRLVDALKKYKRGAIKAIFSQELRLDKNASKWTKCKFGNVISLQSGQDFPPSDYNDAKIGIPYMIGASCIVNGRTIASRWTDMPRCFAYKGDTLLVCKGSGSGTIAMLAQDKVHIARQFMALQAGKSLTKEFCFYLALYLSDRMKRSVTGLIEGIDRNTVLNQDIFLPTISEQKLIVAFLSKLENNLTIQDDILNALLRLRTALMQQLFI